MSIKEKLVLINYKLYEISFELHILNVSIQIKKLIQNKIYILIQ